MCDIYLPAFYIPIFYCFFIDFGKPSVQYTSIDKHFVYGPRDKYYGMYLWLHYRLEKLDEKDVEVEQADEDVTPASAATASCDLPDQLAADEEVQIEDYDSD